MSLKRNTLQAIGDNAIRWVNYRDTRRSIAPPSFTWLANFIRNGTVKFKIDNKITTRIAKYDPNSNTIIGNSEDYGSNYWDEKAVLVHESVHAILDGLYRGRDHWGRRAPMTVLEDEIFAYVAGGLYLVAATGGLSSRTPPEREAIKLAKTKVNRRSPPAWDEPFEFTAAELRPLGAAIQAHPFYRRDANKIATHDGF